MNRNSSDESALRQIMENPLDWKQNVQLLLSDDGETLDEIVTQVKSGVNFVKQNWKTILPALAVLAAAAYFLQHQGTSVRTEVRSSRGRH